MHIVVIHFKQVSNTEIEIFHFTKEQWQDFKNRSNAGDLVEEDVEYVEMFLKLKKFSNYQYAFSIDTIPIIEHSNFPIPCP